MPDFGELWCFILFLRWFGKRGVTQVHPVTSQRWAYQMYLAEPEKGSEKDVWSKKVFPLPVLRRKARKWAWWKDNLNNSLDNRLLSNSIHKNRLREQNLIWFPSSMQSYSQRCLKGIWSRPRFLLQCPRNCQHGLKLTSHVSSIKGHQVTMLSIVTRWRMQFMI